MHAARIRRLAIAAAAAVTSLLALAVAADAIRDGASAAAGRERLVAARAAIDARALEDAAAQVRAAAIALQPLLDGPWIRHAWSRSMGRGGVESLRAELARTVEGLEAAIEGRRALVAALESMRADAAYATTVAQLVAVEARRAAREAELRLDAAEAHAELAAALAARRREFDADIERNRTAFDGIRAARERARGDAQALQAIADAVLPAPARAGEDAGFDALRASAAEERAAILGAGRIAAAEREGLDATTALAASAIADRLVRDPDLARGDAALAGRRAAAIDALRRREHELAAWERSVRCVEAAFAAGEFGAAARALGRLAPCDARTEAAAARLRSVFGERAVEELVRTVIAAADRADRDALARLVAPFAPGGSARPLLDEPLRRTVDEVRDRIGRTVDRLLYEEFRRNPSPMAAARYLEGWPAERRAMAPAVAEWVRAAGEPRTTISLEEIRWGALGIAAVSRGLEDRPDARVVLVLDGRAAAELRVTDIRESGVNGFNDVAVEVPGFATADLEVGVAATIDLRDAILADPRPRGTLRQPIAAWRAGRTEAVAFTDPSWVGCRHSAVIRVAVPKTPPLPPFQGRQQ